MNEAQRPKVKQVFMKIFFVRVRMTLPRVGGGGWAFCSLPGARPGYNDRPPQEERPRGKWAVCTEQRTRIERGCLLLPGSSMGVL
jgi:hypothetical protein